MVAERAMRQYAQIARVNQRTRDRSCGAAVQENCVNPRLQWIKEQQDKRNDLLVLPAVDVHRLLEGLVPCSTSPH